ncbi:hypothetical protein PR202_gb11655 [Eleusine coracana subsp. coracana]|uniref:Uncharacterized protein n=1 Tax=Eleusine coracana subsp. coracana TaxID=191504 RepID=A0AAV5EKR5_ELECO|nr:hypothetical protein PR202_gb11655 [Eleusine coracana subsp. coracana]
MAGVEGMMVSVVVKEAIQGLAAAAGGPMLNLWRSCKADMDEMRGTLILLEAGLRDAERRSGCEEAVLVWLRQLKSVARDISAALDEPPPPPWKVFAKFSLVNKIEGLKGKLKDVEAKRHIFGFSLQNSTINEDVDAKRETVALMDGGFTIVGRSGEKDEIIRCLFLSEESFAIIPIVGLGGIGKTSLAKLVFNDISMQDFERKAWVHVSQRFHLGRIAEAVVSQFEGTASASGYNSLQSLYNELEIISSGKNCLIVLDDLWESDIEMLRKLKLMLRCVNKGSLKVIVTTRNEEIAQEISTVCTYKLRPLSDENCWTVFKQTAFLRIDDEDLRVLEAVGKDIAKKCKGLPLAAHAIASMLHNKTVDFWKAARDRSSDPQPHWSTLFSKVTWVSSFHVGLAQNCQNGFAV